MRDCEVEGGVDYYVDDVWRRDLVVSSSCFCIQPRQNSENESQKF